MISLMNTSQNLGTALLLPLVVFLAVAVGLPFGENLWISETEGKAPVSQADEQPLSEIIQDETLQRVNTPDEEHTSQLLLMVPKQQWLKLPGAYFVWHYPDRLPEVFDGRGPPRLI